LKQPVDDVRLEVDRARAEGEDLHARISRLTHPKICLRTLALAAVGTHRPEFSDVHRQQPSPHPRARRVFDLRLITERRIENRNNAPANRANHAY
jgi:hypothetical protein